MKKVRLIVAIVIILGLGFCQNAFAGLLTDWGITPGSDWIPDNPDVEYDTSVGTVIPGIGMHYDAEALYFYHDAGQAHIALVTVMPQEGWPSWSTPVGQNLYPGDFALNFGNARDGDGKLIYQFGIRASSHTQTGGIGGTPGDIYTDITWGGACEWMGTPASAQWGAMNSPTVIKSGTKLLTSAAFNYYSVAGADQITHYVYETSLPLNIAGMDWSLGGNIHWTETCGNDVENLAFQNIVPEPASFLLFGIGGLVLKFVKRRKVA